MVDGISIGGIANPWRAIPRSGPSLSFVTANNGAGVLKRALARVKPDAGGDAHIRFGKASRFTAVTPEQRTQPGATITWPNDNNQDDEPAKEIHIAEYDWVSRCWEDFRVEQEGEPENWVEVRNMYRVVLVGRDKGDYIGLNLPRVADDK
ncbi:hypothetical protein [Mesorhizobium sp. B4-1-1]|uniref:hypothetical protein n=1 Tax=Mesorhizobium sp. B4-1-1 TaxID=2589890 RepID=UPI00112E871A|nr:hypothetical protein [Mesorhizobium sp. B4-1-1]TPI13878.1 hypothetical protein FJW10_25735 [Mesorhizobium sp. B4-1-1]